MYEAQEKPASQHQAVLVVSSLRSNDTIDYRSTPNSEARIIAFT